MRILDLGAHDGFVSKWLLDRWDGDQLEIDGLELMPEAAAKARERGINCKVGSAEDAPALFEAGSYDAVLMFELIEHVPDMDRLLSAAERMLKSDGRLYVSTPDGCFGEGNNPHHLRALRSIDLADLLRRRGRLKDMIVGQDTVTVASYTPEPRLGDVAIFTGPSFARWAPWEIETVGLGGSETAAVRLAEALSEVGYVVTVYGECEQGCYRDVIFRDWRTFDPTEPRHSVISSRQPGVFDRPIAADTTLLWVHDVDCGDALTTRRAERIDRVVTLSRWHERHVKGRYPWLKPKIVRARNGINLGYFEGTERDRAKRVLYTSSPDRGLDILLEEWPKVREQVPDATLAYCYAPYFWHAAEQGIAHVAEHAQLVRRLSNIDGVEPLGSLSQPKLARLMRESLVWAHPSWCTPQALPFQETSCIGAMEAQAAGLHVVASGWGALRETVRTGALVARTSDRKWRDAFVYEIVRGLTDPDTQAHAQFAGPVEARGLGWGGVAETFRRLIEGEALAG